MEEIVIVRVISVKYNIVIVGMKNVQIKYPYPIPQPPPSCK